MTQKEQQQLLESIKLNAPQWFCRIKQALSKKKSMISKCISLASNCDDESYKDKINIIYNTSQIRLNDKEIILLNYICLIKHKEHLNNSIERDNPEIKKWISILCQYSDTEDNTTPVISVLFKHSLQLINKYKTKNPRGRPIGSGKRVFYFNGIEYHTIQECADKYGITKQGMYKKLKKLGII